MPHARNAISDDDELVRLEWWYDLDRPFLAAAELLSARPDYLTLLATDDGVFPVTMRLPATPEVEVGLANFLAPPSEWSATTHEADEHWGTHSRQDGLGFKGVAIKRLTFSIHAQSALVHPAMRAEWGETLLAQQVLLQIDDWWDTVRTWLEIATNQRLTQIGHEASDALNPHTRTSIWAVDDDARRRQLNIGGTVILGPERVIGVTPEILHDCVALATTKPPMAWTLLRDARALQNADQLRRAVIDAATAAELAATKRIDDLLATETDPHRREMLTRARTLGKKADALENAGDSLPAGFHTDLVDRRNNAVHEGAEVQYPEWESAFRVALELVERVYPLPTAPGSSARLECYWARSARPETFGSEFSFRRDR
jgi:hypothetical protein